MRSARPSLEDCLAAIDFIEQNGPYDPLALDRDIVTSSFLVRQLEIIGEAIGHVPPDVREIAPAIAWPRWKALRNILIHAYHRVENSAVIGAIGELPELRREIERLLANLPNE